MTAAAIDLRVDLPEVQPVTGGLEAGSQPSPEQARDQELGIDTILVAIVARDTGEVCQLEHCAKATNRARLAYQVYNLRRNFLSTQGMANGYL